MILLSLKIWNRDIVVLRHKSPIEGPAQRETTPCGSMLWTWKYFEINISPIYGTNPIAEGKPDEQEHEGRSKPRRA